MDNATIDPRASIHPQAIVEPGAIIGANVKVGPWSFIGAGVEIGEGCIINSHVVIKGPCKIGQGNKFFQFASIGEECQDLKYNGEPTRLEIGDNNIFREGCTIQRGTVQDQSLTRIANNNMFMAYVHVAHDCIVGSHCVLANNATLAGHVKIGDNVILGGFTGVHQFCQIGSYSMCGASSTVLKDVPAFVMAAGSPAKANGMNYEGMKRRGYTKATINQLRNAYKLVYRQGHDLADAKLALEPVAKASEEVKIFLDSIEKSERGIVR